MTDNKDAFLDYLQELAKSVYVDHNTDGCVNPKLALAARIQLQIEFLRKVTWWQKLKHDKFHVHLWGTSVSWKPKGETDYDCYGEYANCKICGKELVIRTPY